MTFDTTGLVAYVNGEYVPVREASVSIFDHGFLYGDGVFEGMRVFDGGLFRAELHMARIARSARTIGLGMPVDTDEIVEIIGEVVRRSELQRRARAPDHHARLRRPGHRPAAVPRADADRVRVSVPAVPRRRPDQALHERDRAQGAAVAGRAREVPELPRRDRRQAAGRRARRARRGDAGLARRRRRVHGREPVHRRRRQARHAHHPRRAAGDHAPHGARDRRRAGHRGGRARHLADGVALRRRCVRVRVGRGDRPDRLVRRPPGDAARPSADRSDSGGLPATRTRDAGVPDGAFRRRVDRLTPASATRLPAPPLVAAIHGFTGSPHVWELVRPRLERAAHVFTPALPGHPAARRSRRRSPRPRSSKRSSARWTRRASRRARRRQLARRLRRAAARGARPRTHRHRPGAGRRLGGGRRQRPGHVRVVRGRADVAAGRRAHTPRSSPRPRRAAARRSRRWPSTPITSRPSSSCNSSARERSVSRRRG